MAASEIVMFDYQMLQRKSVNVLVYLKMNKGEVESSGKNKIDFLCRLTLICQVIYSSWAGDTGGRGWGNHAVLLFCVAQRKKFQSRNY